MLLCLLLTSVYVGISCRIAYWRIAVVLKVCTSYSVLRVVPKLPCCCIYCAACVEWRRNCLKRRTMGWIACCCVLLLANMYECLYKYTSYNMACWRAAVKYECRHRLPWCYCACFLLPVSCLDVTTRTFCCLVRMGDFYIASLPKKIVRCRVCFGRASTPCRLLSYYADVLLGA